MRKFYRFFAILIVIYVMAGQARGDFIGVSGPNSSMDTAPLIRTAPYNLLDDIAINKGMQGFNEVQNFLTTVEHMTDSGSIAAGTLVDSHIIFLNSARRTSIRHHNVIWTFSRPIIGIMSDINGNYEAASTFELGNPSTNYTMTFFMSGPAAPFNLRGMESNDWYTLINPYSLQVNMYVSEPGDWIRVVTSGPVVPAPGAVILCMLGMSVAGVKLRKSRT